MVATPSAGEHPAADVLRVLAISRSTGALDIRGEPGGTIYLHEGDITFAEAPGTPRVLQPGVTERRDYSAAVRAAILETGLILLTAPHRTADRPLFRPGRRHWTGLACRLGVEAVLAEVERQAADLAMLGVGPDGEIRLSGLRRGEQVVLSAAEWEVVARLDGSQTPRALACRSRAPLTATVRAAASLVAAGVCAPVEARASWPPPGGWDGPPTVPAAPTAPTAPQAPPVPPVPPVPPAPPTSFASPAPATPRAPEVPDAVPPASPPDPPTALALPPPAGAPAPVPAAVALPRRAPGGTGVPPASPRMPGPGRRSEEATRVVTERLLDGLRRLP
jgi:hypothetical protein